MYTNLFHDKKARYSGLNNIITDFYFFFHDEKIEKVRNVGGAGTDVI